MAVSLDRRVRDVARARPADRRDLELAHSYVESDPSSALTKIRIVLERMVVELYTREMGEPPKKPLLGDMLANTQFSRRIERRILSRMHAVRDMANLGAHGEAVVAHDAESALEGLCAVLEWEATKRAAAEDLTPELPRAAAIAALTASPTAGGAPTAVASDPATDTSTGLVPRPAPLAARPTTKWIALGATVLGLAAVAVWWRTQHPPGPPPASSSAAFSASGAIDSGSTSSSSAIAIGNTPKLIEPRDGAEFFGSSHPGVLRWELASSSDGFEVEIERTIPAAKATVSRVPAGMNYLVLPAAVLDAHGFYRWRVRPDSAPERWSQYATFSHHKSLLDRAIDRGELRFGIEQVQHDPFVRWDGAEGRYVGFDVSVAEEIARRLELTPKLVPRAWKQLLEGPLGPDYDAVISAVSITPERCKTRAFSDPYLHTGQRLATKKAKLDLTSPFALGVQRNTTSEKLARLRFPKAKLELLDENDLVFAALAGDKVDAVICDDVLVSARPEAQPGAADSWQLVQPLLTTEAYGIVLPPRDPPIVKSINDVLAALRAEGWLAALKQKHHLHEAVVKRGEETTGGCPP